MAKNIDHDKSVYDRLPSEQNKDWKVIRVTCTDCDRKNEQKSKPDAAFMSPLACSISQKIPLDWAAPVKIFIGYGGSISNPYRLNTLPKGTVMG